MSTQTQGLNVLPHRRGSVWRKWDLHVHAPNTVFNNQYPQIEDDANWESFVSAVEALTDVSVLGMTDYFGIDGYKRLLKYKGTGRMSNIDLLLPNIELRLDLLVPSSPKDETAKSKKVNAHVIFSEEVSVEDIEDRFLRQLHFSGLGDVQGTNESCALTRYQLEQLGARLKQQHATFTASDYVVGCMNAAVNFQQMKEVLHNNRSVFAARYLIVLATENTSLISWDSQGHLLRKVLVQGSDAIFGGHDADRLWALGQKGHTPSSFIEEFGALKPCIHGSDAHSLASICVPDKERFCWIKADPTFEGLRQIVFEPADRVYIGDAPPNFKHSYRVLDSVTITGAPDWFSYAPIPLNANLVTIIGGKGAGKSALAELIAFAGGSDFFKARSSKELKELDDTFLSKASKKTAGNTKPLTGVVITLAWGDGVIEEAEVSTTLAHGRQEEKIKYLPQKFVEQVCAPHNDNELLLEVERVVFQRIPKSDRLGCVTFSDLRSLATKGISVKKSHLAAELEDLTRDIFVDFQNTESQSAKLASLAKLNRELASLLKQKPDVSTLSTVDLKKLSTLQAEMRKLETRLTLLKQELSVVGELEAVLSSVRQKITSFNKEISALLNRMGMIKEAEEFRITVPVMVDDALLAKRESTNSEIIELTVGPREGYTVASLNAGIGLASEALILSRTKRAEFDKFETDRIQLEQNILSLENEVKSIEEVVKQSLTAKREQRREKYLDFFEILSQEKEALERLYLPLKNSLEEGGTTDQKLKFVARISFDSALHAQSGMELFDSRRRPRFTDVDDLQAEIRRFIEAMQAVDFDRELSRNLLAKFRENFLSDGKGGQLTIGEQLRRTKTEEDFNNWFFDLSRYSVSYSITFEDKNLSLLSPGQKGIVLLLLYLEVDQEDQRPLVIDQPEDNLDNLSVYSNLIQFFGKRKLKRQLLLITHNPNLVVNTDSEQIIVATYDGAANPKISYRCGALEETAAEPPGIREQVCSILEGGTEAFQKRELKYSLL